jgi:hypothetical protein
VTAAELNENGLGGGYYYPHKWRVLMYFLVKAV